MTATLTVSGANTTIDFNYIGPNATIQGIADGACHRIWVSYGVGPVDGSGSRIPYANLTLTQKLAIIDRFVADTFSNLAKVDKVETDTAAARVASQTTADSTLSIP